MAKGAERDNYYMCSQTNLSVLEVSIALRRLHPKQRRSQTHFLKCRAQMGGLVSTERERALADVKRDGNCWWHVPERYRADREIVLAAVKKNGHALRDAEECKADHDI
eukprot:6392105-Amphidinium_carterae.1